MHPVRRLALIALLLPCPGASAMQFAYAPPGTANTPGTITAAGPVSLGDEARFRATLQAIPQDAPTPRLSLNSAGGNLDEGMRLGAAVRDARLPTVVAEGAMCASACFIAFAAGTHLFASTTALVGVHSVAYGGGDNAVAQAATITMARRLAEYGVPDAILGKLVTAQPGQIWWLTRAELETMRVDTHLPRLAATANPPAIPAAAAALSAFGEPGSKIAPAAQGFRVERPASGFQVWRPGSHG